MLGQPRLNKNKSHWLIKKTQKLLVHLRKFLLISQLCLILGVLYNFFRFCPQKYLNLLKPLILFHSKIMSSFCKNRIFEKLQNTKSDFETYNFKNRYFGISILFVFQIIFDPKQVVQGNLSYLILVIKFFKRRRNERNRQLEPKLSKKRLSVTFANLTVDVSNKNDCKLEKL